jgi:hypothetical protein
MIRSLMLFAHVVGMLTLFAGLGLEWVSLHGIQRSTTGAEASPWLQLVAILPRIFGAALAAIIASGLYLGARVGVLGNDWMRASYSALALMAVVSGPVSRGSMRALKHAAGVTEKGSVPTLRAAAFNPILLLSLRVRIAFGLAVVFLMIAKPDGGESLLVLALASALTAIASFSRRTMPSTAVQGSR